jgi:hypothetical protein
VETVVAAVEPVVAAAEAATAKDQSIDRLQNTNTYYAYLLSELDFNSFLPQVLDSFSQAMSPSLSRQREFALPLR